MPKTNDGAFSPMPERPCSNWILEMAKMRAQEENIPLGDALGQIKRENPQIAEAADLEVVGAGDPNYGANFIKLMRRALEIMKASHGLTQEEALERASVQNPDLARAARWERKGSLYTGELRAAPGIGKREVLLSEGVEAALDPQTHLVMLTNERQQKNRCSWGEALLLVAREHPHLVRAAEEQVLGRKRY
jgi:hypothetical protein